MFGKIFGKGNPEKSSFETILNAAKTFGFDIPKMAQEKIPEMVVSARAFQDKAGVPLFISIALDEPAENFVLSLWKVTENGADIVKSYRLDDLQTFISQLQFDLNNITDDTITPEAEQLAIESTGATTTDTGSAASATNDEPAAAGL